MPLTGEETEDNFELLEEDEGRASTDTLSDTDSVFWSHKRVAGLAS